VATGQATDEIGAGQQFQQQVFQTLLDNGVPRERALLAIQSPEALKAEIAKLNPTYAPHNVGNTTGSFSPQTGQFNPQFTAPEFKTAEPGAQVYSYQPPLPGQMPMRAMQASPLGPPAGGPGPMPPPGGGPGIQASPLAPPAGGAGPMQFGGTQVLSPGMSPQDLAQQRAVGTAAGTAQGQAAATLPNTLASADQALKIIDQVDKHPGKAQAVGAIVGHLPAITPQAQNFDVLRGQLQGQVFLRAYGQLKGAGAISEIEGQKGEQAIGALSRAQTLDQFNNALTDLRDVVTLGRQNAIKIAKGETAPMPPTVPQTQAPQVPAGFKLAPNGKYYSEKPGANGKYQMWSP
jgi:hypothetical protein